MAVTVITHHVLRDDTAAQEWDATMYERLSAARCQPGWMGGQLLQATNDRMLRTIVGTWESRDAWEVWHEEEAFRQTREQLEGLQLRPSETTWYEVIEERRSPRGDRDRARPAKPMPRPQSNPREKQSVA
jgi:heme-degrading monooxygenase HmoA